MEECGCSDESRGARGDDSGISCISLGGMVEEEGRAMCHCGGAISLGHDEAFAVDCA